MNPKDFDLMLSGLTDVFFDAENKITPEQAEELVTLLSAEIERLKAWTPR